MTHARSPAQLWAHGLAGATVVALGLHAVAWTGSRGGGGWAPLAQLACDANLLIAAAVALGLDRAGHLRPAGGGADRPRRGRPASS